VFVTIIAAAFWWAPFVISAPGTAQALGHFPVIVAPGSVLHLIGLRGNVAGWLRPVQFTLGVAVGTYVGVRRHWTAAPLAALAIRVMTDPYTYGYYGLGPLVFALLVDAAGGGYRRLPTYTAATAMIEFGLPACGLHGDALGAAKLIWSIGVLVCLLRTPSEHPDPQPQAAPTAHAELSASMV
jgi:hypothetical protein